MAIKQISRAYKQIREELYINEITTNTNGVSIDSEQYEDKKFYITVSNNTGQIDISI